MYVNVFGHQDEDEKDERDESMDSVMSDVHFDQLGKASRTKLGLGAAAATEEGVPPELPTGSAAEPEPEVA
jgi:hypothetical protein